MFHISFNATGKLEPILEAKIFKKMNITMLVHCVLSTTSSKLFTSGVVAAM